jgi:phospholipid N-methyltransferase
VFERAALSEGPALIFARNFFKNPRMLGSVIPSTLVVIEINDDFVDMLSRRFSDPRLRVVHRSAAEVVPALRELGLGPADYVISGIPFSIMEEEDRLAVLRNTYEAFRAGGSLLVDQFSSRVRACLESIFGRVHQVFEPRNILPAHVFYCVK